MNPTLLRARTKSKHCASLIVCACVRFCVLHRFCCRGSHLLPRIGSFSLSCFCPFPLLLCFLCKETDVHSSQQGIVLHCTACRFFFSHKQAHTDTQTHGHMHRHIDTHRHRHTQTHAHTETDTHALTNTRHFSCSAAAFEATANTSSRWTCRL